jgi:signal transduction histidine kinase
MPHEDPTIFDAWDRAYLAIRVASGLSGIAYALVSARPEDPESLSTAFLVFLGYTLLLYWAGWRLLRTPAKQSFYLVAATIDLAFVTFLISLTGGAASPFYRALYLWLALQAFYFGRRGGLAGAAATILIVLLYHARARFSAGAVELAGQAGGLLLHGALVGFLADRGGRRVAALREAHNRLAEANRVIREEHAKLVQAEKLSSIGLIAAGVAHEINNPLSGVMGCMKALRDGTVRETSREQYFETVTDGLNRIRQTVQSLLDYARPRPPSPTTVDVAEVTGACVQLVEPVLQKKDVRVDCRVGAGQALARADRGQVVQAMVNVLLNAAHAVPDGGSIVVSAPAEDGRVGICVTDDGPGIPPEIVARVCDPFFTTKPQGEGTGLGLSITLGIARANGGDVSVANEKGRGAAVTIWLPSADGEPTRA